MRGYLYIRENGEMWVMQPGHEAPLLIVDKGRAARAAVEILQKMVIESDRQYPDRSRD